MGSQAAGRESRSSAASRDNGEAGGIARKPAPRLARTLVLAVALLSNTSGAATGQLANLGDLTLEQLSNIDVTSVSRRAERLADAAAAVYVISAEDIRRSGANSIPEALRLAPNLQVARANTNQYAVTARGFNSVLANKMLVLIDGRTVYSPLFSGVFWESQQVMLEDVDRIEVISGSAGTLWGSNAVNGVINVITRPARETQGALVTIGAGNREKVGTAARYGGELGGGGHYRVYGRYFDRAHSNRADRSTSVQDASDRGQAGFRADWDRGTDRITLQGDAYNNDIQQGATTREVSGMNLLGRWNRTLGGGSRLQVQAYFDRTERNQPGSINDTLNTFDVEFQHGLHVGAAHNLLWGGGYRMQFDRLDNLSPFLAFRPADRDLHLGNVFVQDEIRLRHDIDLTLGLKLEHNSYTGLEYLPNARLAWRMGEHSLVWGAVSRAVRTPSRIDREFFSPANPPFFVVAGGPTFESEVANVVEFGFRAQPITALSYSVNAYHTRYERLRSLEATAGGPMFENRIEGNGNGVEAWASYRVAPWWRLNAGAVYQSLRLTRKPESTDTSGLPSLGNDPGHWWTLRSSFDLTARHEFDIAVRHVGALPNPVVPSYTAVDARLGWRVNRNFELSVAAQNLFDRSHAEWGAAPGRAEYERGVFVKALWRTQ